MKYIDKIYGEYELSGVIEELVNTAVFQRLMKIHQGGAIYLANPKINHTRFEHSIGVMFLVKSLGASVQEQIAALLHDISHTAFSHLIDYVFELEEEDYHEKRYTKVLEDQELTNVLTKYGFLTSQFFDLQKYQLLEYPLPYLSADRIDYTLRDLFQIGEISKQEINWFLTGLQVFENRIVLKSRDYGIWFRSKYEFLVSDYFGSKENIEINIIMKRIVRESLAKCIITERDFSKDDFYLIEKINSSKELQTWIDEIRKQGLNGITLKIKKRMVNPEILKNNKIHTLKKAHK